PPVLLCVLCVSVVQKHLLSSPQAATCRLCQSCAPRPETLSYSSFSLACIDACHGGVIACRCGVNVTTKGDVMINVRRVSGGLRAIIAVMAVVMLGLVPASAQDGETYTEPGGRWSAPLPTNWTAEEIDADTVLFNSPEGDFKVYIIVTEAGDDEEIAAESWARVNPDFDLEYDESDVMVFENAVQLGDYDAGSLITYAD